MQDDPSGSSSGGGSAGESSGAGSDGGDSSIPGGDRDKTGMKRDGSHSPNGGGKRPCDLNAHPGMKDDDLSMIEYDEDEVLSDDEEENPHLHQGMMPPPTPHPQHQFHHLSPTQHPTIIPHS